MTISTPKETWQVDHNRCARSQGLGAIWGERAVVSHSQGGPSRSRKTAVRVLLLYEMIAAAATFSLRYCLLQPPETVQHPLLPESSPGPRRCRRRRPSWCALRPACPPPSRCPPPRSSPGVPAPACTCAAWLGGPDYSHLHLTRKRSVMLQWNSITAGRRQQRPAIAGEQVVGAHTSLTLSFIHELTWLMR